MLLVQVLDQFPARALEGGELGVRPRLGTHRFGMRRLGKQPEKERIPQERIEPAFARVPQEVVRLFDSGRYQDLSGAVAAQRIEPQQVDLFSARHREQFTEVASPQPGFLAARQPETRFAQLLNPTQDLVQRFARISPPGALLIQPVDEQGLPSPLRMAFKVAADEVTGCHVGVAGTVGLAPKRRGLARSSFAEQDVGVRRTIVGQRPASRFPSPAPVPRDGSFNHDRRPPSTRTRRIPTGTR